MATGKQTTRFIIKVGDGGEPEVFGHVCGANTFGVTLTNNLGENVVLDCNNPLDVPSTIVRHLESQDTSATISGMIAMESLATWRGWADSGTEKNIQMVVDESAADGGGFWSLPAFLGNFELGKEGSGKVTFSAALSGAGARTWTAAT